MFMSSLGLESGKPRGPKLHSMSYYGIQPSLHDYIISMALLNGAYHV